MGEEGMWGPTKILLTGLDAQSIFRCSKQIFQRFNPRPPLQVKPWYLSVTNSTWFIFANSEEEKHWSIDWRDDCLSKCPDLMWLDYMRPKIKVKMSSYIPESTSAWMSCIKVVTHHYSAKQLGWIPIVAGQSFQISFHVTIEKWSYHSDQ